MFARILQVGERALRAKAAQVDPAYITSPTITRLIDLMRDTMRDAPGVGLAAPQIGESIQLVVIEDREEYHRQWTPAQLAEQYRKPVNFHVLVNPELTIEGESRNLFFEGCLSVRGYTAAVDRAATVRVRALNEHAEPVEFVGHGWYARILQHEFDHLQGCLYTDRMEPWSFMVTREWERYWKNEAVASVKNALYGDRKEERPD